MRGLPLKAWANYTNDEGVCATRSTSVIQKGEIFTGYDDEFSVRSVSINVSHLRNNPFVPCSPNLLGPQQSSGDFYFNYIAAKLLEENGGAAAAPLLASKIQALLSAMQDEAEQRRQAGGGGGSGTGNPRSRLFQLFPNLPVVTLTEIKSKHLPLERHRPVRFPPGTSGRDKRSFFHVMTTDALKAFFEQLPHFYNKLCAAHAAHQKKQRGGATSAPSSLTFGTRTTDAPIQDEVSIAEPVVMLNGDVAHHKMGISIHDQLGASVYLKYQIVSPGSYPQGKIYLDLAETRFLLECRKFVLGELMFLQDCNCALTGKSSVQEAERDEKARRGVVTTVYHKTTASEGDNGEQVLSISLIEDEPWPPLEGGE